MTATVGASLVRPADVSGVDKPPGRHQFRMLRAQFWTLQIYFQGTQRSLLRIKSLLAGLGSQLSDVLRALQAAMAQNSLKLL